MIEHFTIGWPNHALDNVRNAYRAPFSEPPPRWAVGPFGRAQFLQRRLSGAAALIASLPDMTFDRKEAKDAVAPW